MSVCLSVFDDSYIHVCACIYPHISHTAVVTARCINVLVSEATQSVPVTTEGYRCRALGANALWALLYNFQQVTSFLCVCICMFVYECVYVCSLVTTEGYRCRALGANALWALLYNFQQVNIFLVRERECVYIYIHTYIYIYHIYISYLCIYIYIYIYIYPSQSQRKVPGAQPWELTRFGL
jgi:hypothetical protein